MEDLGVAARNRFAEPPLRSCVRAGILVGQDTGLGKNQSSGEFIARVLRRRPQAKLVAPLVCRL